ARALELDSAERRDPDRKPGEHLVDLRVAALVDADPVRTWNRLHPRVGEWPPLSVTTENVEPRVEKPAVPEPSRRAPAPGRTPFPGGVGAAVTGVEGLPRVVCKRQALAEYADPLHDHGAVGGSAGPAAREPPGQSCAAP